MLVDDPVKRVDNMTMAWGLEARVPFLDHEVVELASRIPGRFKTGPIDQWEKEGGKHILKEVARDVIPAEVIDRPKGYFPVPALKEYVSEVLEDPERHITPLRGSKLWQLALLERWMQVHLDQ